MAYLELFVAFVCIGFGVYYWFASNQVQIADASKQALFKKVDQAVEIQRLRKQVTDLEEKLKSMGNEFTDKDDEDMKYGEEKESELSLLATTEQKYEMKKYFENLSEEELNKKFKYYLYNSLIENTVAVNTLFSGLRDFNHKKKKIYQKHRLSRVSEAIDLQILIEDIYPLFHLDINICLITCEYSYEPIINILAIDHRNGPSVHGKYFHFDYVDMEMYCNINEERGQRFKVYIKRTKYTGNVIIWLSNGGGSRGNAHGRFDKDPMEAIGSGYFKVGDQIQIIERL